jgi:thioredoxin-like negative regulator of GroEL
VLAAVLVAAVFAAALGIRRLWRYAGPGRERARLHAMERFLEARRLVDEGRLVAAERNLRDCLRVMPEHFEAVILLFDKILYPQGRSRDATVLLIEAHTHVPPSLRATSLMLIWTMQVDPDQRALERIIEDIAQLRNALEVEPVFENRLGLAFNYVRRGEPEDLQRAFPLLEQCLRERPDSFEARRWMFECLMGLQQVDQAARLLDDLPESLRSDPDILRMRAQLAVVRDDPDAAVAAFRRLIELRPADVQAHYQLGRFYKQIGCDEQSARHFERYTWARDLQREAETLLEELKEPNGTRTTGSADNCYRLGEITQAMGFRRQARWWYEACLDRRPGDRRASEALRALEQSKS